MKKRNGEKPEVDERVPLPPGTELPKVRVLVELKRPTDGHRVINDGECDFVIALCTETPDPSAPARRQTRTVIAGAMGDEKDIARAFASGFKSVLAKLPDEYAVWLVNVVNGIALERFGKPDRTKGGIILGR